MPRFKPVHSAKQQVVVARLLMAYMRDDRGAHRILIELTRGSRPPYPAAVLAACVLCDDDLTTYRAARKQLAHPECETLNILLVQFLAANGFALAVPLPDLFVRETLAFCLFESVLLHEKTLPFVSLAGPAPLEYDR